MPQHNHDLLRFTPCAMQACVEKENVYTIKGCYQDFDRRENIERLKKAWEYYREV